MFRHVKDLQFNAARVSPSEQRFANLLLEQFGGENGELAKLTEIAGNRANYPASNERTEE